MTDELEERVDSMESKFNTEIESLKTNKTLLLENLVDDTMLNRVIQLRSIPARQAPLPDIGKMYYDSTNKKLKMYTEGGWADVLFTTTSTSTTTTSTSSTSTSTTTT